MEPMQRDELHEDVLQWLSAELDGELPERQRILLTDHLDGCPRCAAVARDWRATRAVVRRDAVESVRRVPVGLADRIVARLEPAAPFATAGAPAAGVALAPAPLRVLRRSAALAAACLALIAGLWIATEPSHASATVPRAAGAIDDPALQRVLERWQKGRAAPPSFFELVLPASR